jgi:hypothetical protein
MPFPQTTGARGLHQATELQEFIAAKTQSRFSAERAGTVRGNELFELAAQVDKVAADKQNATWRQEHTAAYTLARDFRYGHRSRRWLFSRSLSSGFDHAYEQWASFVRENLVTHPGIVRMLRENQEQLSRKTINDTLNP